MSDSIRVRFLAVLALAALGCASLSTSSEPKTGKDGMIWVRHAFPTGRESTSAVLLERGTPPQVPIGQPLTFSCL